MANEQEPLACPMPTPPTQSEDELIRRLVKSKRIAVVGISDRPDRPSFYVSEYMQEHGAEILPVNPTLENEVILGHRVYGSLKDVPGDIDLVDVFRRPQFCPDVVRDAIAAGAKAIWLQSASATPRPSNWRARQASRLSKTAA